MDSAKEPKKPKDGQDAIKLLKEGELVQVPTKQVMDFLRYMVAMKEVVELEINVVGCNSLLKKSSIKSKT